MPIQNALASVAVKNLDLAIPWYEELLGQPASKPMPEVAEWKFKRGGGLQIYLLPERAGSGSLTLTVSDIDEQISRLEKLGINTGQKVSTEKVKTVMITDPDCNHIAFAQAIYPGLAQ
jgi:predicted enzyme related to lactoylglutathione lyase